MSILTFLLAGIGAFGPYQQSLNGLPGESGASGGTIGYWYIYTYSSSSGNTKSDGTVLHCQNIINNKTDLFRLSYDVSKCKCIISAAALAVLAFLSPCRNSLIKIPKIFGVDESKFNRRNGCRADRGIQA